MFIGNHEASGQFSRSHKEMISIKTLLCSTKLTQNGNSADLSLVVLI